jgi:hypothetical protein
MDMCEFSSSDCQPDGQVCHEVGNPSTGIDCALQQRVGNAARGQLDLEGRLGKARYSWSFDVRRAKWRRPRAEHIAAMTKEEERELRANLARLQQEHRDLDAAIEALQRTPGSDKLQVQRLKKRKLSLKDRITFIEDQLTPDIIA